MTKYLILWETDNSKMPTDPAEQAALIGKQMEMTKKATAKPMVTLNSVRSTPLRVR